MHAQPTQALNPGVSLSRNSLYATGLNVKDLKSVIRCEGHQFEALTVEIQKKFRLAIWLDR